MLILFSIFRFKDRIINLCKWYVDVAMATLALIRIAFIFGNFFLLFLRVSSFSWKYRQLIKVHFVARLWLLLFLLHFYLNFWRFRLWLFFQLIKKTIFFLYKDPFNFLFFMIGHYFFLFFNNFNLTFSLSTQIHGFKSLLNIFYLWILITVKCLIWSSDLTNIWLVQCIVWILSDSVYNKSIDNLNVNFHVSDALLKILQSDSLLLLFYSQIWIVLVPF